MRLSLLMFVFGIVCIISGYVQSLDPQCEPKSEIKFVPRNVYDQIVEDSVL